MANLRSPLMFGRVSDLTEDSRERAILAIRLTLMPAAIAVDIHVNT
jgi:hypothetical protein